MQDQHTPGPWAVGQRMGYELPIVAAGGQGHKVAAVGVMRGDEGTANARLIAEAPNLLNALRSLLRHVERLREDGVLTHDDIGPEFFAREAIEAATGTTWPLPGYSDTEQARAARLAPHDWSWLIGRKTSSGRVLAVAGDEATVENARGRRCLPIAELLRLDYEQCDKYDAAMSEALNSGDGTYRP